MRKTSISSRMSREFVFSFLISCVLGFLSIPLAWAQTPAAPEIPIARVMRDYQTKYNAITGLYITWPNNANGTPASVFPDDNF